MTFEELIAQARELPITQRKTMIHELVESLNPEEEVTSDTKKRIAGLHAGQGWVSDDFNDELPDSFWLGQAE